jgi:N-acetylmuramoyl-L-alanine amidase
MVHEAGHSSHLRWVCRSFLFGKGGQSFNMQTDFVGARVAASPNYRHVGGRDVRMIVLHGTAGGFDGALRWLTSPSSRVSAHFLVSRSGEVVQMVAVSDIAWHAGRSYWHGERDINGISIGIEMENIQGQDWPDVQLYKVADICRTLMTRYGISWDEVVGHRDVAYPPGRKTDPQNFPWERFKKLIKGDAR